MSDTSSINAINLQVSAEDLLLADKASGVYAENKASDPKYYLWHSDFQTYPVGMDGEPEVFIASMRAALPQVNTLRLPFNEFSFNEDGSLHEQYERMLEAAADQGLNLLFVYMGGDAQRYGTREDVDATQIYDKLQTEIHDGMIGGWTSLMNWLDAHPDVAQSVYGFEAINEPATYFRGADMAAEGEADRFVELYGQHVSEIHDLIRSYTDEGKFLVGGGGHSGNFDLLDVGNLGGQNVLDYLRAQIGDDLVWSAHLYPGWLSTSESRSVEGLEARLENIYDILGDDDVLITETNAPDHETNNPAYLDDPHFLFPQAYEWFAEHGMGLTWFPGVETGASNFAVLDPDGTIRYLNQNSLAQGLNGFSLDETSPDHAGAEYIETDIVKAALRTSKYADTPQTYEDVDGAGFGFGYAGDDTIAGHDHVNDFAYGGTGQDLLIGAGGNDHLYGQYGDDTLLGGEGDDLLHGGDGADLLDGGTGNDQFEGGDGADLFLAGTGANGITDFSGAEGDLLRIDGQDYTLQQLMEIGQFSDVRGSGSDDDLVITHDGGTVTLYGAKSRNAAWLEDLTRGPVEGGEGDDTISVGHADADGDRVTDRADTIRGGAGNDLIEAGDGEDLVEGGSGDDRLEGMNDNDTLIGGAGRDTLIGGAGNDLLVGGDGTDSLSGWGGDDTIIMGKDTSYAWGQAGDDRFEIDMTGGANHRATGNEGHDSFLLGGAQSGSESHVVINDFDPREDSLMVDDVDLAEVLRSGVSSRDVSLDIEGSTVRLTFIEGNSLTLKLPAGFDFRSFYDIGESGSDARPDPAEPDVPNGPEAPPQDSGDDISLTEIDDDYTATDAPETVHGRGGDDTLLGWGGDDTIFGDDGSDNIKGGTGDDLIHGGSGNDEIITGPGNDKAFGDEGNDHLTGWAGRDVLEGGAGEDTIEGGTDDDWLDGGDDSDRMNGGAGADTLTGGAGNDTVIGGAGDDLLISSDGTDHLLGWAGNDHFALGRGHSYSYGNDGDDRFDVDMSAGGEHAAIGGGGADTYAVNGFGSGEVSTLRIRSLELEHDTISVNGEEIYDLIGRDDVSIETSQGTLSFVHETGDRLNLLDNDPEALLEELAQAQIRASMASHAHPHDIDEPGGFGSLFSGLGF